ncbi:MAG: efflux RND transporter periplasmic adaptor subunit [Pseudomonadota bacterium]
MKKILIGIVIIVVLVILARILIRDKGEELKFKTEKIRRGNILSTVTATGTVNPVTTVLVGTQISGTIKRIYVDFNSIVKKGQIIAWIDPATFEAQVEQARANLLSAKAGVKKAEAALLDARRTMERNRELFSRNLIARSDTELSETNYDSAMAQTSAAKAQVAQAEAALRYAETNLKYTKILSPIDGIVVSRNVDVGQTVAASFQTPTLFTIAQDLTKMQIDTNVDEADIGKVKTGMDVEFTVDAYPDLTFKGAVSQVRNAPITVQNVVTYDVVVNVDNPEYKLKPGMTVNVSIIVSKKENILKIPNTALRFKDPDTVILSTYSIPGVWILKDEKPKRITVKTGISDGNHTELLSGKIREGQEVIVESLKNAKSDTNNVRRQRLRFF